MRPSQRTLWIALLALLFAVFAVVAPFLAAQWALVPFGLLIIAFVGDWFISLKPGKIDLSVSSEREVFSGEASPLELRIQNVKPRIFGTLSLCEGFSDVPDFEFINGIADVQLTARRRGVWVLEKCWLRWKSRMGLIEFSPVRQINRTINVVPNIRMITSGQIDLELKSTLFGGKQTAWRGEGSEFHQLNEYVQGMDPRSIDWKRSARARNLVAKEMRAERNHQIIMAMDGGYLMREEIDGLTKLDHNINAALATAWAGVQGGDQVGLFAFDARPRLYSPPQPGRAAFSQMRSQMAEIQYKSIETNHTLALSSLHQRLSKRSLIVVFSDFVDPLSAQLLVEHMSILNRHHVVIYVSIRDPFLQEMAASNVETMTEMARSVSAANLLSERRKILDKMSSMGVFVIETDPGNLTIRLINTYLSITARELI